MKKEEIDLLEILAELEHQQWMNWAKSLMDKEDLSNEIVEKWNSYFVPYTQLPEEIKELDRVYARKVIGIISEKNKSK